MNRHDQFAEDLALYAMGALSPEEALDLEKHLQSCADCGRELAEIRGSMALLAASTDGPMPPARSKKRLLDALGQQPRIAAQEPVPTHSSPWWAWTGWAVAAILLVVAGFEAYVNTGLREQLSASGQRLNSQQAELAQAQQIVSTLTASDAQRFTLVSAKVPPQPQAKAIYVRKRASLIFLASNLPALPAAKAYELWLIPTSGAPLPAGVFTPDAHGNAVLVNPPLPAGVEAKTFAITVEPQSGSPAPSSQPILVGTGS
jgi:anti-sigma-K factor RskA